MLILRLFVILSSSALHTYTGIKRDITEELLHHCFPFHKMCMSSGQIFQTPCTTRENSFRSILFKCFFLEMYSVIMLTDFIFYKVNPFLSRDIKIIYNFKGVQKGSMFEWTPSRLRYLKTSIKIGYATLLAVIQQP